MAALNGLNIDPATARHVVKYLANNLGLAPEEAKPAAWEVEKRWIDFKYAANADAESACNKCHSLGRVISQRRTRGEWELLIAMHRGWYPLVDNQAFRRGGPAPARSIDRRPPARHASSGREGHRSPRGNVPVEDRRLGGVVGEHAAGAARWHVGAERLGAWQGRDLRHGHGRGRSRDTRRVHDHDDLSCRANRRNRHPHGPRHRLHRIPVARPLDGAGGRFAPRSDDDRSRLAAHGRALVYRRLR